jgi:cysteine desulfurase
VPAYLDYAATAPLRPAAREAWLAQANDPANPASLHATGRRASEALEQARDRIAELAGASAGEVIWTSGGTESDAIALRGLARRGRRVLVGATEHKAVLDTVQALPDVEVCVVGVEPDGRLNLAELEAGLGPDVAFAAVMAANNETGAVNDLGAIRELCTRAGVAWHCDAVQWPATRGEPIGADTVAYSAHKLGGPVGVGALVVRKGIDLPVYSHGGGQEAGIRSGTVNVAGAAAFAAAWTEADERRAQECASTGALRDRLQDGIAASLPDAVVNGGPDRLASHLNVTFPGCPADSLLMLLDREGVEVSAGSACSAGIPQPSHVLVAMGLQPRRARESLRFSLGWATTSADVDRALAAVVDAVRLLGGAGVRGGAL